MTDRTETDEILDGYLTADFDPLQAFAFDDDTDADDEAPSVLAEGPFNMPNPEAAPQFQRDLVAFDNGETAEERIDALFAQMPTFHKMLFAILSTCASPIPTADLEAAIVEMKRHHHSVYEPLTLCNLLERAGAIEQTDEGGTPLAEVEQEPLRVEVDGVEYWRVAPAPEVFWSLTEAGAAKLDSYRPMEMIAACTRQSRSTAPSSPPALSCALATEAPAYVRSGTWWTTNRCCRTPSATPCTSSTNSSMRAPWNGRASGPPPSTAARICTPTTRTREATMTIATRKDDAAETTENAALGTDTNDEGVMTAEDLAALCESRSETYSFLARLFREEVDEALLAQLNGTDYPVSSGNGLMDEGYYQIAKYLSNAWVDPLMKLSVDYTRAFLGSGIDTYSAAYPFESVYTSEKRLLMSDARDEVLAIYRSCGLEKSESWTVGEDHVAVELEFMGVLAHRAAKALRAGDEERAFSLINTQRNFMDDHLASWVPVFLSDTRRFADTTFYQGVANVTEGFLEEDAALLADLVAA